MYIQGACQACSEVERAQDGLQPAAAEDRHEQRTLQVDVIRASIRMHTVYYYYSY